MDLRVQAVTDIERGSWGYSAGVSGTVAVSAGRRVLGIAAYSTAGGTLTTPKNGCANPLADGLSLRRRPLGRRLKGVRFVSETEETGGKRWRAHDLIRNLLAERHRGTPILFRTAKQVQS